MKVRFDKKADALYIRFSDEKYFQSDEVRGGLIVDLDKKGKIIGLEVLDASKNLTKKALGKLSFKTVEKQPVFA